MSGDTAKLGMIICTCAMIIITLILISEVIGMIISNGDILGKVVTTAKTPGNPSGEFYPREYQYACAKCDAYYGFDRVPRYCIEDRQMLCQACYPELTRGPVPYSGNNSWVFIPQPVIRILDY